jgi:hypothetical protein
LDYWPVILVLVFNVGAQIDWPELMVSPIATGASYPVHVTHSGDGSGRLFVVEQGGRILIATSNGFAATPFLDLSDRVSFQFGTEDGLLNLVFHGTSRQPQFMFITRLGDWPVLARFSVSVTNADGADPNGSGRSSSSRNSMHAQRRHAGLRTGWLPLHRDGRRWLLLRRREQSAATLAVGKDFAHRCFEHDQRLRGSAATLSRPARLRAGNLGFGPAQPFRFSFDRANGDLYISDGTVHGREIDYEPAPSTGGHNWGGASRAP